MKTLGITYAGIEDVSAQEVTEILNIKSIVYKSCIEFSLNNITEIQSFAYNSRSFRRILELLSRFTIKSLEDFENYIKKKKFKSIGNFAVRCLKENSDFSSKEIEELLGDNIEGNVDLENPDTIYFVYINNNIAYICIDHIGIDLSKRDYKIFNLSNSLKGNIGYSLLKIADWRKNESLLDPFTNDGIIPVEAALYANDISINYYRRDKFNLKTENNLSIKSKNPIIFAMDKTFNCVSASKKNAKIANINKSIKFSRLEINWLDTKFEKDSIDKVVTQVPKISKYTNPKEIQKLYKEFFYQLEFILKSNGKICVLTNKTDVLIEVAKKNKFRVIHQREITHGKQTDKVVVFEKLL